MSIPLRSEYTKASLDEKDLDPDPIRQFLAWFEQALEAQVAEPNAMTLATATPDGAPSARIVLLKGVDERGFIFHSSYESRKGRELARNPRGALVLFWPALERQVRIEGRVEQASAEESDEYFRSRPPGSQIGAWASTQSAVVPGREALERLFEEIQQRFAGVEIPRPPNWGGYRVVPESLEFWQGRPSRLHDRLRYSHTSERSWIIERLAP